MELCLGCHHQDVVARAHGAVHHADIDNDAFVAVIVGVENQRLQRSVRVAGGSGDVGDNALEHLFDVESGFSGDARCIQRRDPDDVLNLMADHIGVGTGQVDLVDHRNDLQVVFNGKVGVGKGLCLDALGGIHHQQCALAGSQRAGNLVVEVHVTGGVDEVEFIQVAVLRLVLDLDSARLDGNAALTFQVHVVQQLVFHLTQRDGLCLFQDAVGECGLAVVDVGDDAEVADTGHILLLIVWHGISPFYNGKNTFKKLAVSSCRFWKPGTKGNYHKLYHSTAFWGKGACAVFRSRRSVFAGQLLQLLLPFVVEDA